MSTQSTGCCRRCLGRALNEEEIVWRLKFLAAAVGSFDWTGFDVGGSESCGLMWLLYDIADMIESPRDLPGKEGKL